MLTSEQIVVLQRTAALYLKRGLKTATIYFEHKLCEGSLTGKREGVFVGIGGTFFHVYLGTVDDVPWTMDFLLRRGAEVIDYDKEVKDLTIHRRLPGGSRSNEVVDPRSIPDGTIHQRH